MNWDKLKQQKQKELDSNGYRGNKSARWLATKGVRVYEKGLYKTCKDLEPGIKHSLNIESVDWGPFQIFAWAWFDYAPNYHLNNVPYSKQCQFVKLFVMHVKRKNVSIELDEENPLKFYIEVP